MSLEEFLKQNGYTQIPLTKNGVGHFQTKGFLNGKEISVLIDTGASNTVFNLDLINEMNLSANKLSVTGGGAGAAQLEIYQIENANFTLDKISLENMTVLAMDLSHANEALKSRGSEQIDAVLGADILETRGAVIDYGCSSLFLKN